MIGVGEVSIGVFALNISVTVHSVFGLVGFVFAAASAIMSYKFEKSPLSYISVILGAVMLLATVLLYSGIYISSGFYLGLGSYGMELFITFPYTFWMLGFGAYLIRGSRGSAITSKA
jgi:hypothetical protein